MKITGKMVEMAARAFAAEYVGTPIDFLNDKRAAAVRHAALRALEAAAGAAEREAAS